MDCFINNNKDVCLALGKNKCSLIHKEKDFMVDQGYYQCMEELYKSLYETENGENSLLFCQYAFGNYSQIYQYPKLRFETDQFAEEADELNF